jgi:hypothetical protein
MQGDGPVDVDFIDIIDRWAAERKPVMALPAVAATLPPAPPTIVPQAEPTAAEPVQPTGRTMATGELADAFDGIMDVTSQQWRKRLGDLSNHPWLKPARARLRPLRHTRDMVAAEVRGTAAGITRALSSNRAFLAPQLKPWLTDCRGGFWATNGEELPSIPASNTGMLGRQALHPRRKQRAEIPSQHRQSVPVCIVRPTPGHRRVMESHPNANSNASERRDARPGLCIPRC